MSIEQFIERLHILRVLLLQDRAHDIQIVDVVELGELRTDGLGENPRFGQHHIHFGQVMGELRRRHDAAFARIGVEIAPIMHESHICTVHTGVAPHPVLCRQFTELRVFCGNVLTGVIPHRNARMVVRGTSQNRHIPGFGRRVEVFVRHNVDACIRLI